MANVGINILSVKKGNFIEKTLLKIKISIKSFLFQI